MRGPIRVLFLLISRLSKKKIYLSHFLLISRSSSSVGQKVFSSLFSFSTLSSLISGLQISVISVGRRPYPSQQDLSLSHLSLPSFPWRSFVSTKVVSPFVSTKVRSFVERRLESFVRLHQSRSPLCLHQCSFVHSKRSRVIRSSRVCSLPFDHRRVRLHQSRSSSSSPPPSLSIFVSTTVSSCSSSAPFSIFLPYCCVRLILYLIVRVSRSNVIFSFSFNF